MTWSDEKSSVSFDPSRSQCSTLLVSLYGMTSDKKKNLSTVVAKGRKGLRKGHAPARAMYAGKSAAVRISAFMDMYDCFQNTVGKVDMWYVNRRGKKKKKSRQRAGFVQNSMNSTSTRRLYAIEIPPTAQFSRIVDRATLKYQILFTNSRYFPLSNQVRLMTVTCIWIGSPDFMIDTFEWNKLFSYVTIWSYEQAILYILY